MRLLYDRCLSPDTGERSCVLVRFYKTHPYGELEPALREFARAALKDIPPDDAMRCLTLMATTGELPQWNSRRESRGHQAIPLPSSEFVREAPMIRQLIEDIGLDIDDVVHGNATPPRPGEARNYDVFHVEHAVGSPHIPAQQEFVERYGVKSVVGFGGLLRTGELFSVILFSRHHIPEDSATRFRAIALDIRSALFLLEEQSTWIT